MITGTLEHELPVYGPIAVDTPEVDIVSDPRVTILQSSEATPEDKEQAFRSVVEEFEPKLQNRTVRIVRDPEEARDILQSIYLSVWQNFGSYRQEGTLENWLMRVTTNKALDALKHSKRQPQAPYDFSDPANQHLGSSDLTDRSQISVRQEDPAFIVEQKERVADIGRFLACLVPEYREVVDLRIKGYTNPEIAQKLQIPDATVRTRMYRGRRALRALLESSVEYNLLTF